jgi:hypothetical protein
MKSSHFYEKVLSIQKTCMDAGSGQGRLPPFDSISARPPVSQKDQAPVPEARPHTARGVHPAALPSWFHIVMAIKTTLLSTLRNHSSVANLVSDRVSVTGLDGALRL